MQCLDQIEDMTQKSEHGLLAIFTQEGCPYCPEALTAAKEALGDEGVTIYQAPVEKDACGSLADRFDVSRTPTLIYFDKTGRQRKRVPVQKRTWGEIKAELAKLPNMRAFRKHAPAPD